MAYWKLKINIAKEIKALKEFCENFSQDYEFEGENETKYMELCKDLENKFRTYETSIKEITEDDGTYEELQDELESLLFSADLDNSNYCMERIYEICDTADIWLEQLLAEV